MLCHLVLLLVVCSVNFVLSSNPCDGKIVILLDASKKDRYLNTYMFKSQKNMVKKLFTRPYFDGFERLAIGSYGYYGLMSLTGFGDFQNELDVVNYVDPIQKDSVYQSTLYLALEDFYNRNYPSTTNDQMTLIVFVSDIIEYEVDKSCLWAKKLQDQGVRLVLVGHTDRTNADWFSITRLERITEDSSTVFSWDPTKNLPSDNYQQWFNDVINCRAIIRTTKQPHVPNKLCDGNIVVVLDASCSWSMFYTFMFNDQNNLVKKLFRRPYFDGFERLAIGSYVGENPQNFTDFGDFRNEEDVANYVNSIQQDLSDNANLIFALPDLYKKNYPSTTDNKITVIFFVSGIYEGAVDGLHKWAQKLQDQGVRLVLIGHTFNYYDDYFNITRLERITGNPNDVFDWNSDYNTPSDDYEQWFSQVLHCQKTPNPTMRPVTYTPTVQPSVFTPCRKRIVFAIDDSETNIYFKFVNSFLYTTVLTEIQWNHIERLGVVWYSDKIDHLIAFDSNNKLEDIREAIRRKPIAKGTSPDLSNALKSLDNQFQTNLDFDSVFYIVFVSQLLTQEVVDSAKSYAKKLEQNGRLTLIGLGAEVDENLLYDLTYYETIWRDPTENFPDWQDFFSQEAYGCGSLFSIN